AHGVGGRGAALIVASHNRAEALRLSQELQCRHVQFEAIYSTMHDVLVVCDREEEYTRAKHSSKDAGIHPGYLRAGMTVMDVATASEGSSLLEDAAIRGCRVVAPLDVLREQLGHQLRVITGKEVSGSLVNERLDRLLQEKD